MSKGKGWSAAERVEMWRRYKAGESQGSIGLALGRKSGSIFAQLAPFGGIAPRRQRSRSARVLSLAEREEISRGLAADASIRAIAQALGRAPSTVSREVRRHAGQAYRYRYRAKTADGRAWERARRPKACLLSVHPELQGLVAGKLHLDGSPQQISGWLKEQYPADESMRVSPETIYRTLFVQARGALKKELLGHLRGKRRLRRSRVARQKDGRGQIADAISIRERPAEVEDRAVPGHWEGDLLLGSKSSQIATLVERQSRFCTLIKVPSRETDVVVGALARHIRKLPTELRRSLTWDRGREMKHHKDFTVATDVQVYFCDPSSPWQRGTNENTNGLLRQYFPKGTDLSGYSQAYLDKIALRLNQRPRKTLGFKTPADKLQASVALTD
jgi:IS30 family transposase